VSFELSLAFYGSFLDHPYLKQGIMMNGVVVGWGSNGTEYFKAYPKRRNLFNEAGWISSCKNFQGYNDKVTRVFVERFDVRVKGQNWNQYFLPYSNNLDWSKGILHSWLKEE